MSGQGGEAAPPPLADLTVVRPHPLFGRSAFAARSIKAGELVICEEPLLSIDNSSKDKVVAGLMKHVQQYRAAHPQPEEAQLIHEDDWASAVAFFLSFCRAPAAVQRTVLEDMHAAPEGPGVGSTPPVVRARIEAAVLAALAPEVTKVLRILAAVAARGAGAGAAPEVLEAPADAKVVERVLLAVELNVHFFGQASAAMYAAGSKLTHTCSSPNTYYKSCRGRGCHVAMRDIEEGELLTTTYLPQDHWVMSGFARRRYLWEAFSFVCACERCTGEADALSALPCPRCAAPDAVRDDGGFLPPRFLASDAPCRGELGLLRWDPSRADPTAPNPALPPAEAAEDGGGGGASASASASASADGGGDGFAAWVCSKCGVALPDVDTQLIGPYKYVEAATARLEAWAYSAAMRFDPRQGNSKIRDLVMVMGPCHWALHFALGRQSELIVALLSSVVAAMRDGSAKADALDVAEEAVRGLAQNHARSWAWLTEAAGMPAARAAEILHQGMAVAGSTLLQAAAALSASKHRGSQRLLHMQMVLLARELLSKAELRLSKYRAPKWPLPEAHPLVVKVEAALAEFEEAALSAPQPAAAGGGGGSNLSMEQLLDFLPTSGSGGGGGGGGNKSKGGKKKGGKR